MNYGIQNTQNIEIGFRQVRIFTLIFVGVCALVTIVAVGWSYRFAEAQRQRIYVLDNGRSLLVALSQDLQQNRPVEAREHVRRFHELFFTLSPDKAAIESNIERAMMLADKSVITYYKDLSEKGFFNRLIAGNVNQRIEIDSVVCNFEEYPYQIKTYAGNRSCVRATLPNEVSLPPANLSIPHVRT